MKDIKLVQNKDFNIMCKGKKLGNIVSYTNGAWWDAVAYDAHGNVYSLGKFKYKRNAISSVLYWHKSFTDMYKEMKEKGTFCHD